MAKIWALHSGDDWYDAAAEYLVLPDGMDFAQELTAYRKWYIDDYLGRGTIIRVEKPKYMSFFEWLIKRGAREPSDDELEIVDGD